MPVLPRLCLQFLLLVAFAGAAGAAETIKVAHLGLISDGPFFVAQEEGYFA
jgi:ABC-type nitrate/sulfonate/bicarbonate transport system substrate-binding protein